MTMEKKPLKSLLDEIRTAAREGIKAPADVTTSAGRMRPPVVSGVNMLKFLHETDRPRALTKFTKIPEIDYKQSTLVTNYIKTYDKLTTSKSNAWALAKLMQFARDELHIEPAKFDLFLMTLKRNYMANIGRVYRGESVDDNSDILDPKSSPYRLCIMFKQWMIAKKQRANSVFMCLHLAKGFMKNGVEIQIDNDTFRSKVKPPRYSVNKKEPMSLELAREILLATAKYKFRSFAFNLTLAAGGFRAIEACALRIRDLHLNPEDSKYGIPYVVVRAEYTKMGQERDTFLTQECADTLKHWLYVKYRMRDLDYDPKRHGIAPEPKPDHLVFGAYKFNESELVKDPKVLYSQLRMDFSGILHILGRDEFEEGGMRRIYTLHSFRRLVKTTISSLGYYEYSEGFIGHTNSTYHRLTDSKRVEIFKKVVEPALTYLDYNTLAQKQQDLESQLDVSTRFTANELSNMKREKSMLEGKVDKLASTLEFLMSKEISPEQRKSFLEFAMQTGTYEYAKGKEKEKEKEKPRKSEDDAYSA